MSDGSEKLLAKLDILNDSLDELEAKLEPLLAQTLPESLLPLETIQQVKLNVAIPYLVYDLVFIYLKTRGIDPKTHPVVAELDRVRQYFEKIKNAEDPEKSAHSPPFLLARLLIRPTRTRPRLTLLGKNAVDKAAANRFIKHAIAQVRAQRPPGESEGSHIRFDADGNAPAPAPSGPSASEIAPKVTSKMRARAEYERQLAEQGSEEEDQLEVFADEDGDGEEGSGGSDEPEAKSSQGKGKGKARATAAAAEEPSQSESASSKKRRRPAVDPFAGYGDDQATKSGKKSPKKQKASAKTDGDEDVAMVDETSGENTPVSTPSSSKRDKNASKKAKKRSKKASLG
ncbi:hypothetical protein C8Q77DRAFT_101196 [Trametes polyzona]|nr:hypothetical protein C8Q77DRAFT_101196 [Trametes polyzona]